MHCALVSVVSDLRVGDCVGGRVCHVSLVGMAAIGKMAIRSIVLSSRFGLFHLGKRTANKSVKFFNFFWPPPSPPPARPPTPYTWCTCDIDDYAC